MRVTYDFQRSNISRTETLEILCANCSILKYEHVENNKTYKIVDHKASSQAAATDSKFDQDVKDSMQTEGRMDVEVFHRLLPEDIAHKNPGGGKGYYA
uniref:Putative 5'-nucleotidase/apyrase n=1 Tax=Ixodes ricinus TaxID=34613 RepID=A0A0K8RFC2_IXORI